MIILLEYEYYAVSSRSILHMHKIKSSLVIAIFSLQTYYSGRVELQDTWSTDYHLNLGGQCGKTEGKQRREDSICPHGRVKRYERCRKDVSGYILAWYVCRVSRLSLIVAD
jgi:hypothetical protein